MTHDVKVVPLHPSVSAPADALSNWQQPREVTLEEVADAIIRLSRMDEAEVFTHP